MKFEAGSIIQTNSKARLRGFPSGTKGKIARVFEPDGYGDGPTTSGKYFCEVDFKDHNQWSGYLYGDEFTLICKGRKSSLCDSCPEKPWCRGI
ncbi:MAG: hypothetical protein R6T78_02115 [Dehalococcoidales bacterium]